MKIIVTILALLLTVTTVFGQTEKKSSFNFGVEQDILPYVTGGYYGGAWLGKGHIRARVLAARVKKPAIIVPDGFSNNWVSAYALVGDYFLKEGWTGWNISTGFVYWKNSIELSTGSPESQYETYLLHGSIAHTFTIYGNFYITPWAGMHLKVGGPGTISINEKSFKTPLLNPEASVKLGVYF